jgi:hypothetical protein
MHFADTNAAEPDSMCARFTLTAPPSVIAELFGVDVELGLKARYNIVPTVHNLLMMWTILKCSCSKTERHSA